MKVYKIQIEIDQMMSLINIILEKNKYYLNFLRWDMDIEIINETYYIRLFEGMQAIVN